MSRSRRWTILLELFVLAGLCAWLTMAIIGRGGAPGHAVKIKVQMRDAYDGRTLSLTPEQFADRVYADQMSRGWLHVLLNVTSPVGFLWVSLGLLGQVLFTGRMLVQWVVSERAHRSTVPTVFWWMSLVGAAMLLVYFLWRRDPVGLLGQSFGFFVYARNLWMIYRGDTADGLE